MPRHQKQVGRRETKGMGARPPKQPGIKSSRKNGSDLIWLLDLTLR